VIPRAALRRTLVVLAVVAWPVASLAIVQAEAPSLPALRALARAERVDPPGESIDPPPMLRPIAVGDAALALRSLDDVAQAIAPVRGEPAAVIEAPPNAAIVESRRMAAAGDAESAVRVLAEHLRRDPADVTCWRELGRVLDAVGRRDLSNEAWGRVLAVEPLDAEALANGGVSAASVRQPLVAAERLLRLRQMQRVGEAPEADPRVAIGHAVALGLSLRELGHLSAAAECLDEAWRASRDWNGPDAAALRRQGADLLRIAGECAVAAGDFERASARFREALAQAEPEDRVALPRLAWALRRAGRPAAAACAVAEAAMDPRARGRSGLPGAWPLVPVDLRLPRGEAEDPLLLRARLIDGAMADASALLERGHDRTQFGPALAFVAERAGLEQAIALACDRATAVPAHAAELASALRCMAASPDAVRGALRARAECAARLLLANFELVGGEAHAALECASRPCGDAGMAAAFMAIEALAAGAMESGARVLALSGKRIADARVAAALADAFIALGDREAADRWAERAISLDERSAEVWAARARADLMTPVGEGSDGPQLRLSDARLAAERGWDAAPDRSDALRALLQLLTPEAPQRAEVIALVRSGEGGDVALRELDRSESLRRAQAGQGEPALEPLRALLLEDPLDAECARAFVTASASAGQLAEAERFLDALRLRRPAAAAAGEALVTALAKLGRLSQGVALVREASQAEPGSLARRLAWARALSAAGRPDEAWAVCEGLPPVPESPRLALERVEFALRASREDVAMDLLRRLARAPLSRPQRLAALALVLRVPAGAEDRRSLAADLGLAALASPESGPLALAAAMMGGDDASADRLCVERMRPWTAPGLLEAAQRLIDEGMGRRATSLLRRALERVAAADRRAIARAALASLAASGDVPGAVETLRAQRAVLGKSVIVDAPEADESEELNELAGFFLMAGHDEGAADLFERAVADRPTMGEALNNLAWLRIVAGRLDVVTGELVRRALEASPDEPSTLDTAGWWSYRSGAPIHEALDRLRRATASAESGIEPLDHLGDALWVAGRREDATATWRSVVERGRGSASRASAVQAFDRMQSRRAGIRAWDGGSFYDARDGAAIARAQAKLQAIAEGREPPIAPRSPATPAPDPARVP
jgi:tetratricopeptide (TPR) repeat protein